MSNNIQTNNIQLGNGRNLQTTTKDANENQILLVSEVNASGTATYGTAGSPSTAVQTIQGITSGTPVTSTSGGNITSVEFNRPANTTAYTGNQTLSPAGSDGSSTTLTLSNFFLLNGGTTILTDLSVHMSSNPGTKPGLGLLIYTNFVNTVADQTAFTLSKANFKAPLGKYVDIPASCVVTQDGTATTTFYQPSFSPITFTNKNNNTLVYLQPIIPTSFTPTSSLTFVIQAGFLYA